MNNWNNEATMAQEKALVQYLTQLIVDDDYVQGYLNELFGTEGFMTEEQLEHYIRQKSEATTRVLGLVIAEMYWPHAIHK